MKHYRMQSTPHDEIDFLLAVRLLWKSRYFMLLGLVTGGVVAAFLAVVPRAEIFNSSFDVNFNPPISESNEILAIQIRTLLETPQSLGTIYQHINDRKPTVFNSNADPLITLEEFGTVNPQMPRLQLDKKPFDDGYMLTLGLPFPLSNGSMSDHLIDGINMVIAKRNERVLEIFGLEARDQGTEAMNTLVKRRLTETRMGLYGITFDLYAKAVAADLPVKDYLEIYEDPKATIVDEVEKSTRLLSILRQAQLISAEDNSTKLGEIIRLRDQLLEASSILPNDQQNYLWPTVVLNEDRLADSEAKFNSSVTTYRRSYKVIALLWFGTFFVFTAIGIIWNFIVDNKSRLKTALQD